eukprot:symbB.v1.2.035588.t1/scaffold4833.1/size34140/1
MAKVVPVVADRGVSDLDKRLLKAADHGRLEEVKELLQSNANIEATVGFFAYTPLHLAVQNGHRDVVDLLLDENADIEAKNGHQQTPLHHAVETGHRDIVGLLLDKKAQIEAKGAKEQTPLHHAVEKGHRDTVNLLLEKKAQIEAKGAGEQTPLHHAVEKGHRDIVDLLLEKKADIEAKGRFQRTPLHRAVGKGDRDIVDLLLEKKADIEAKDRDQETPLHAAAFYGRRCRDIVDLLLDENADIEAKNGHQQTPLHMAVDKEFVKLLVEKDADLGAQDDFGVSALDVIFERSLQPESFGQVLAKKNLWSRSALVALIKSDDQDSILGLLEGWPQNAYLGEQWTGWTVVDKTELKRASVPERLRTVLGFPRTGVADCQLESWDAEFSAQNLYWAPEVPVTLKYLPGVRGDDALNEDFLKILADSPHDGIFETDAVQAMILAAWQQYRAFTLLEIISACLTVICLCWASYGFRHGFALSTPPFYVVAALHLKKSLDESVQALPHLVQCLKCSANQGSYITFDNAADALYLVGGWLAIARQLIIGSDELEKPWMAVFAGAAWLRLLYSLRAETWMGPRLLPILSALKDTLAFFLLMFICIASAAHAYYNLQVREEPTPTYAALMQVVRLGIFADFDLFEFEGSDPTYRLKDDGNNEWEPIDPSPGPDYVYVHVLFYVTGVGITVLLMNVLVGVLSSNYERYEAQSVGQFFRARVKMLVELQGRPIVGHISDFRSGGSYRWLFVCLRGYCRIMLLFILFIACLPCLLIMFLVCLFFFRKEGMMYTIYCSLGWFGNAGRRAASECRIFLVVRDEPDGNEVRSVRTALKIPLERIRKQQQDLESKIETKLDNMEKHHQDLESKMSQIHELLLEVPRTGRRNSAEEPEGPPPTAPPPLPLHHQDLESKIEKIETKLESKIEKVEHTMSQIHELLLEVTRTGRRNSAEEPEGPPPTAPPPLPLHHQDLESKIEKIETKLESKIEKVEHTNVSNS